MLYLALFFQFFLIGALSFGGGYASLTLIQSTVVEKQGWLTSAEFADILTLSEITPGPIALNAASFAGFRTAGIAGSIAATLGCAAPSCILVSVLAVLYMKYRKCALFSNILAAVRPAVCAMIASSFMTIVSIALIEPSSGTPNAVSVMLFAGTSLLMFTQKFPAAAVILFSGMCGVFLF
ncbi:MAG: chromate transporter [Clostridia bacterium]|nr:chromate transporter [Clostridia bacterium]